MLVQNRAQLSLKVLLLLYVPTIVTLGTQHFVHRLSDVSYDNRNSEFSLTLYHAVGLCNGDFMCSV